MKTGATPAVLSRLRKAGCALTSVQLVEALGHKYDAKAISSALGNLVRQGRVRSIRLLPPQGRCSSAYAIRPVKEARPARPKSACLLAEIYG